MGETGASIQRDSDFLIFSLALKTHRWSGFTLSTALRVKAKSIEVWLVVMAKVRSYQPVSVFICTQNRADTDEQPERSLIDAQIWSGPQMNASALYTFSLQLHFSVRLLLKQIAVVCQRSTLRSWNDAVGCLIFSGKNSNSSLSWIQLCSLCSKVFRVMELKLFQPPVSPLCLHHSTVMMTLRRDSAAGGVRLSLLSSLKANIRQRLHHSFVFHCTRCAAGCTLIKHASVFF